MTENLNAENGTTPTENGRDDALTALVEAALLEIADDTTNAEPAAAAIDATIDTLKESILGELWPEERSVLTGLGPAAAARTSTSSGAAAAPAPAPAPPAATEEAAAAPTEYVADETRDAALARAVNGMALEYEGVAPPAEWDRQFEEGEWQEWPDEAAATAAPAAAPQAAAPPAHHPNSAYVRAAAAQAEREKAMAERLTTSAMRNRAAAAQAAADAADAVVATLPSRPN